MGIGLHSCCPRRRARITTPPMTPPPSPARRAFSWPTLRCGDVVEIKASDGFWYAGVVASMAFLGSQLASVKLRKVGTEIQRQAAEQAGWYGWDLTLRAGERPLRKRR